MPKGLIIVESPAKTKTIKRFLGKDYDVQASMGHVRDLPKNRLGVQVNGDFTPRYVVMDDKKKVVEKLKKAAEKADQVYFASDPDREGEAIAWHLAKALRIKAPLKLDFNEITETAIKQALENPRPLHQPLVDAQQARRVLDRLVGYQLSPLLWRKIKANLSAGRVQSVAVRLVVDREKEIENFVPVEYWSLHALLATEKGQEFEAELALLDGKKAVVGTTDEAGALQKELSEAPYAVKSVKVSSKKRTPAPPFITSTLQQQAGRAFGWSPRRTMAVAQRLYEGVDLPDGTAGLITYMRTDSTRISNEAKEAATSYIEATFGKQFVGPGARGKQAAGAQDAHEAIRPSDVTNTPEKLQPYLKEDEAKLYELIWQRFLASQMAPSVSEVTTVDVAAGKRAIFRATASKLTFAGFTQVYQEQELENGEEKPVEQPLPPLAAEQPLNLKKLHGDQHFTKPPARYSEGTLVRALEERGIGRPSTYAPILDTIQEREYVAREKRQLLPTPLGREVTEQLEKHFANIMDYDFTAALEHKLDDVEEGSEDWLKLVQNFWEDFSKALDAAHENMERTKAAPEPTGKPCPQCGKELVIRAGRYGKFLSCSNYPECRYTENLDEAEGEAEQPEALGVCPQCGANLVRKRGRYGPFVACSNYPECKFILKQAKEQVDTGIPCPREGCEGALIKRTSRKGKVFWGCSKYPDCDFAMWDEPTEKRCPECGSLMGKKITKTGVLLACSSKPCGYKEPLPEETTE